MYKHNTYFHEFIESWIEFHKTNLQETTYYTYKIQIDKHIIPYFKAHPVRLSEMKAYHIQAYYTELSKLGLSSSTILKHHANIHSCLNLAYKTDLIENNFAKKCLLPKKKKFRGNFLNTSEIDNIVNIFKDDILYTAVLMALYLGGRRSELLALRFKDIDFNNKTISLRSTVVCVYDSDTKGQRIILKDEMKSETSRRNLGVPDELLEYLRNLKKTRNAGNNDFILVNEDNKHLKPDFISHHFKLITNRNNINNIRFHDLRHSCGTLLKNCGFNLEDIRDFLGHSDIQTTSNYVHTDIQNKHQMAKALSEKIKL